MLIRLMRELGELLVRLWAEQAMCVAGSIPGRGAAPPARGLNAASGRRDAAAN